MTIEPTAATQTSADKLARAEQFLAALNKLFDANPNEDLACLRSVTADVVFNLQRVIEKKRLSETDFYRIRAGNMLAATLLTELHDEGSLDAWIYLSGDPNNPNHSLADFLVEALQEFSVSLESGRMRNFAPLGDAELSAIAKTFL